MADPQDNNVPLTPIQSSWAAAVGLSDGQLQIAYKDGAVCTYPYKGVNDMRALLASSSPGRYIHQHLMQEPYVGG